MGAKFLYNSDEKGNIIDNNKVKYIVVHQTSGANLVFTDYSRLNKNTRNKIRDFHDLTGYLVHNQRSRNSRVCPKQSKVTEWNTYSNKLFEKNQAYYEFLNGCINFPYHYTIDRDGTVVQTLPPDLATVLGATGFNENSIHIVLAGGGIGDPRNNYKDVINEGDSYKHKIQPGSGSVNFDTILNASNTSALRSLLDELTEKFKSSDGVKPMVIGHADTYILRGVSIDKACPGFNAYYWYNFPTGVSNYTKEQIDNMTDNERNTLFENLMYRHLLKVDRGLFLNGVISYENYDILHPTDNWH